MTVPKRTFLEASRRMEKYTRNLRRQPLMFCSLMVPITLLVYSPVPVYYNAPSPTRSCVEKQCSFHAESDCGTTEVSDQNFKDEVASSSSMPMAKRLKTDAAGGSNTDKATIAEMNARFGREIRVFETSSLSPSPNATANKEDQTDEFYELTDNDYYKLLATKKEDKILKTRNLREAEVAACRPRMTKAVIRVRFPDNHTLEATFNPSETIQSLVDLLNKVIAQPEKPFDLYTTTPKKKLIKDVSQDFYTAGFCPGAIVYFSYDVSKGEFLV